MQKKRFDTPDQTMTPPHAKVEMVSFGNTTLSRSTFEPGWKWSVDIKPLAGTDTCQAHHLLCVLSGKLQLVMDDGSELTVTAGDVVDIPAGHDGWVVGDEPVVGIDIGGSVQV